METLWSKIIWNKLNLKDYEIHKEPFEKTMTLVLDYFRTLKSTEIINELEDLTYTTIDNKHDYYDGFFNKFEQGENNKLYHHDSAIFPLLLQLIFVYHYEFDDFTFDSLKEFIKEFRQKQIDEKVPDRFDVYFGKENTVSYEEFIKDLDIK